MPGSNAEQAGPDGRPAHLIDLGAAIRSPFGRTLFRLIKSPIERAFSLSTINDIYSIASPSPADRNYFATALRTFGVSYDLLPEDLAKIPATGPLVVVANHPFRDTTLFDTYFSLTSLDWQTTFKGTYEPSTAGNSYHLFEVNGESWLIVSLEFGPRDAVLDWANRVLQANPSANAIVLTHAYLYSDATRFDHLTRTDQAFNPHSYGVEALPGGVNDGEEIWQKLIVNNANVRIVLCGHVHAESHLTSTRDAGPPVHQILADYQDDGQGGDGYLRIMTFQPNGTINVSSYSPYLKQYRTDAENLFTLSL